MLTLLRYNQPALKIPFNRFIGAFSHDNLIEVHYYDDNEKEISILGYHLMHCWKSPQG